MRGPVIPHSVHWSQFCRTMRKCHLCRALPNIRTNRNIRLLGIGNGRVTQFVTFLAFVSGQFGEKPAQESQVGISSRKEEEENKSKMSRRGNKLNVDDSPNMGI